MGHNINRTNGIDSVFVVGEPAWHKLGQRVDEAVTSEEAIQLANLNYEVKLEPVYLSNEMAIEGKFATVRQDTKKAFNVLGSRYRVLQNKDAFGFFDEVVGTGEAMYHSAGALGKGEKIWLMAKLPKDIIVKDEEKIEQYLILVNSHDGLSPIRLYYSPVRVVCQNTLNMSLKDSKQGISIRHTQSMDGKISEARRVLGLSLDFSKEFEIISNVLANKSMTVNQAENYFDSVLSIGETETTRATNQKNRLLELFENGKGNSNQKIRHTLWAGYNAVTEYVDYEKSVKKESEDSTRRLDSIWFGAGANLKARAFDLAKNLVTI